MRFTRLVVIAMALVSVVTASNARAEQEGALMAALEHIKTRVTIGGAIGKHVSDLGGGVSGLGLSIAGTGGILQFHAELGKGGLSPMFKPLSRFAIQWGGRIFWLGLGISGVGTVISILEPAPAYAATMADYYTTSSKEFAEFLALPLEHQHFIASGDPNFAQSLIDLSSMISQIEQEELNNK